MTLSQVRSAIKQTLVKMERTELVKDTRNYLHYTFTSKIFRFVDDVQFYIVESDKTIHFRSASRRGYNDLGVNRDRMEEIRNLLPFKRAKTAWDRRLSPEQIRICRDGGTENPYSGRFVDYTRDGEYACSICGNPLFDSKNKIRTPEGWPIFNDTLPNAIITRHITPPSIRGHPAHQQHCRHHQLCTP